MRTIEACKAEFETVTEYLDRVFGAELRPEVFTREIEALIGEKIEDYIYQRFRDWPVRDLKLLLEAIPRPTIPEEPLRRGRKLGKIDA